MRTYFSTEVNTQDILVESLNLSQEFYIENYKRFIFKLRQRNKSFFHPKGSSALMSLPKFVLHLSTLQTPVEFE